MWFNDKKVSVVGAFPVIVIIVQIILVEMCLYGACSLMNILLNSINHAEIIYVLIFNKKKLLLVCRRSTLHSRP